MARSTFTPNKILFLTNSAWTLYQFRVSLMLAIQALGFEVVACAPRDKHANQFDKHGIRFIDIPMSLAGTNPLVEATVVLHLWKLYRKEKPVLVHHFSTKSVVYGSLAARLAGVKAIMNTITGLGYAFARKGIMQNLIIFLYKLALRPPARVIFQNPTDRQFFTENELVRSEQTALILGSGINTETFSPAERGSGKPSQELCTRFLMYSRMLWEKGVKEYIEAAKEIQLNFSHNRQVKFVLLGGAGQENATSVDEEWIANPLTIPGYWLEARAAEGYVEWVPHDNNVLPYIHRADVVVLPSYYPEGLPRSLLESMACGKAIITTDTPGCRDAIEDGVNGLLVKPKNVKSLVKAMTYMIEYPDEVKRMGKASRQRVLDRLSDEIVIKKTLDEYQKASLFIKKRDTSQ